MRWKLGYLILLLATCISGCGGGDLPESSSERQRLGGNNAQVQIGRDVASTIPENIPESAPKGVDDGAPQVDADIEKAIAIAKLKPVSKAQGAGLAYSPYVPLGWIDDDFTNAWTFTFSGGRGAYAFQPPPVPVPIPVASNIGGLLAYRIAAVPVFNPVPLDVSWHNISLSGEWRSFLRTSMGCYPDCGMVISDIQDNTPPANITTIGGINRYNSAYGISLGSEILDNLYFNPTSPRWEEWQALPLLTFAKAIDRKDQRLLAAWAALEKMLGKVTDINDPSEYQYALMVTIDGLYPDVRYGAVHMKVGDVWKFGTSLDPDGRYPANVVRTLNLSMVVQTTGTKLQCLIQEKVNLIAYYIDHGELPPGNKIFK